MKNYVLIGTVLLIQALIMGCQPKTAGEKAKDKIEDAGHDMGQGIERAGEKVKDAAN